MADNAAERIGVMIVDDHPAFRYGIKMLLESTESICVVAEAEDTSSALAKLPDAKPEIMLLDIQLGLENGIDAMSTFLEVDPDLKIIFLTAFDTDEVVLRALSEGAYAFVPKREGTNRIIDVIEEVHSGERVLSGHQTDVLLRGLTEKRHHDKVKRQVGLTERETELLSCIAQGMTNAQISEAMYISVSTVKRMTDSVVTKLGASNKTQAVALAVREGLI